MKQIIYVIALVLMTQLTFGQSMNRTALQNYTITNIYENPDHAITGQVLQNTLLDYGYSLINWADTTSSIATYNYVANHGTGIPLSDTNNLIATHAYVNANSGIPFSDTNNNIATYSYVKTHGPDIPFNDTNSFVATRTYVTSNSISFETATVSGFAFPINCSNQYHQIILVAISGSGHAVIELPNDLGYTPINGETIEVISPTADAAGFGCCSVSIISTTIPATGTDIEVIYDSTTATWYEIK